MSVELIVNIDKCKAAIEQKLIAALEEAAGEVLGQVVSNTPVDTGDLKRSWEYIIDEDNLVAIIGSPLENSIWTEFGTGEYAYNGDGRKGGWSYKDDEGKWHHTLGKPPKRCLRMAFITKKPTVKRIFENKLKEIK